MREPLTTHLGELSRYRCEKRSQLQRESSCSERGIVREAPTTATRKCSARAVVREPLSTQLGELSRCSCERLSQL